jgi:hypothetical protein
VAAARLRWDAAARRAEEELSRESRIAIEAREVERSIPRVVDESVAPECRDLGPDIQRLFNDAIDATGDRERGGSAASSDADG